MRHIGFSIFFVGVLATTVFGQTIHYTVDPNSVQCAGSFEASPVNGGTSYNGCYAWSLGEYVGGTFSGSAHDTIYGTCRTNHNEVYAHNGVGWYACSAGPSGA